MPTEPTAKKKLEDGGKPKRRVQFPRQTSPDQLDLFPRQTCMKGKTALASVAPILLGVVLKKLASNICATPHQASVTLPPMFRPVASFHLPQRQLAAVVCQQSVLLDIALGTRLTDASM